MRSLLGFNDNPNVKQFVSALKKILTCKFPEIVNGNCLPQDDTELMTIDLGAEGQQTKMDALEDHDYCAALDKIQLEDSSTILNSQFSKCIVIYIAGWVLKRLERVIKCERCFLILCSSESNLEDPNYAFINRKDNGGLKIPTKEVAEICLITEELYRNKVNNSDFKKTEFISSVLEILTERSENPLIFVSGHECEHEPEDNPNFTLPKLITTTYVNVRMHHTARVSTLQNCRDTVRSTNTKLTQFRGN